RDALSNLIENALRYGPPGQPIEVAIGPGAWIAVRDRGPGVKPEDRVRVFEPFWRGVGSGATGCGLGLAIVAEAAIAHAGRALVRGREGGGAGFRIGLPERAIPAPAPPAAAAVTPAPALTEAVDAR